MMYKDKYNILPNEEELIIGKNDEFKLFYYYVKKIYYRCRKEGLDRGRVMWEEFPYDFYKDIEQWIHSENVTEIKEYIDEIKIVHPCVCESAKLFWQHWLSYKNIKNKNLNKLNKLI